ncbi:PLP dependent protein [Entomortierella parvispora]|uniref:Pyridoxal phosphate homeostasis protein n=1 Tax=Entomortierella parvispora TaxID=205924 RepID=A0A9P3LU94_9FUNG|nr:PLP dependent protein [Entomortierella parvispora]
MSIRLLSLLKPTTTLLSASSTASCRIIPSHSITSKIAKMTLSYTAERAQELTENLSGVRSKMETVLHSKGAAAQQARLVAVSKLKPASDILATYEKAGHRNFGENYVQELEEKSKQLPSDIQWHFIGSLQSNKCKIVAAIPNLYVVETVDSSKKASTLDKACTSASRPEPLRIFLQVNTSGEETKSGMLPNDVLEVARHVVSTCPHLKLAGFMTIGSPNPALENGENPDFKILNECRSDVEESLKLNGLELSMGMSDDFQQALIQGSTNIRVGSTIFGSRPPFKSAA